MDIKNIVYATSCLLFCIVIGAGTYEHIAVWPHAFKEPPVSLAMFQGKYGLYPAPFWKMIHPATLVFFISSLILHWKTGRRKNILIAFAGYAIILVITFSYFVPTLMSITESAYSERIDPVLVSKASMWQTLSLVRLSVLIILSIVLLTGLSQSNDKK